MFPQENWSAWADYFFWGEYTVISSQLVQFFLCMFVFVMCVSGYVKQYK